MTSRIPQDLGERRFDLIVIGAGVNGAGIARDASLRGLKVLVLEQDDLCSGTSSWNSRLIHGGLRYLEHGELGLVRESLRDREILLRTAPHLVRPLPLLIPIYNTNKRGPLLVRLGMIAYDVLSYDKTLPRHRMFKHDKVLAEEPGLNPEGLRGAAMYYDAQVTFPERLVLENLLCAREHGAELITYARAGRILLDEANSTVQGVEFEDRLGGGSHQAYADAVINVAGPWVDQVLTASGRRFDQRIGGTKGTHIVVSAFPGAPTRALYAEAAADARPYFTLPWNGLYLIGTTDTRYEGDPGRVEPTEEEIEYLVAETNRMIPSAQLTRASVLYAYAGVRPLPYVGKGSTGAITRRHLVVSHGSEVNGLWSVIGGKLTTYRHLSEEAVELIGKAKNWKLPRCPTRTQALPGGATEDLAQFRESFQSTSGLEAATARRLVEIYGVRAQGVVDLIRAEPELGKVVSSATGALAAEIVHAFREEMAQTLTDALMRRTMVGIGPCAGLDAVEAAAAVGQHHLGWTAERARSEIATFRDYITRFHPQGAEARQTREAAG